MEAVSFLNFILATGVLIPGFILMAARPVQPAGVITGFRNERRR